MPSHGVAYLIDRPSLRVSLIEQRGLFRRLETGDLFVDGEREPFFSSRNVHLARDPGVIRERLVREARPVERLRVPLTVGALSVVHPIPDPPGHRALDLLEK